MSYYFTDSNDSNSKTPTIEMYAPNTYNGGYDENLSSISAKSETYSNVSPEYNVSMIRVSLLIHRHLSYVFQMKETKNTHIILISNFS